jgi:hypothetical protein
MEDAHAVQVVGYDNSRQAWLIKNSWGAGFANKGFAWVAYDAPGMCDRQDTYGFVFTPLFPQPADLPRLSPAPGRKGCYTYRAVAGDYPERLASRVGIPVQQLLLDNLNAIKDPSALPAGTTLLLCGISPAVVAGAGSAIASSISDEVAALQAIKRVLDPTGTAFKRIWQPGSTNHCRWIGVTCDASGKRVTKIDFYSPAAKQAKIQLFGRLPSGAMLRRLPALVLVDLSGTGVGGELPEDWSQLTQLEEMYLSNNQLSGECRIERLAPAFTRCIWCTLSKAHLFLTSCISAVVWAGVASFCCCALIGQSLQQLGTAQAAPVCAVLCCAVLCCSCAVQRNGVPYSHLLSRCQSHPLHCCPGTMPPSWGALAKLKVCRLDNNTLSGPLPGAWSGMAALVELGLSINTLTGGTMRQAKIRRHGLRPGCWDRMTCGKAVLHRV